MNNAPPDLNTTFEKACDRAFHEKCREQLLEANANAVRVDAGIVEESQLARPINKSLLTRDEDGHPKNKHKKAAEKYFFRAMLQKLRTDLEAMEKTLARKYGENFAANFAADLLPSEQFEDIMKIKDKDERRRAFAEAINDGIQNGTIDQDKAHENPDFKVWLDKHAEYQTREIELKAANYMTASDKALNTSDSLTASAHHNEANALDSLFSNKPFS